MFYVYDTCKEPINYAAHLTRMSLHVFAHTICLVRIERDRIRRMCAV